MPDYNFLNLSAAEFEELSRDILQKHLELTLESFTAGPDKGIDLRHTSSKASDLIVQCKRYKDYNSLIGNLKIEVSKVKNLNPKRYIVTTSVGLTPDQKENILELFYPYIKSPSDIFGKNDLNNLLGKFPEIEKQHFKLWLSSTSILERILHSKIYNQSSFEEEKVKETIKVYVENPSYNKALEIIKNKKYVIISGVPGVGKTTLARILVYQYLATGFEEFIFLSDSINDGYTAFKEDVKQVFLFDDFLGRNFLDKQLSNNEEQRIVRFIEKISNSKDKILILTTREYILSQAKQKYDIFENPSLEFAKCIIDLSQYTTLVRAKILYNHLFFSGISEAYIDDMLKTKAYNKIIGHPGYNPRIIETITNQDVWRNIKPDDFSRKFIGFLNYPESVWKHVYENQISPLSQCILANLMTAGTPILLEDLRSIIQNFARKHSDKYGISFSELNFKKSIRELENTFISINKDGGNHFAIDYQNPSVQDFLVNYFNELPDYLEDLITISIYFNQLFRVFAVDQFYEIFGKRLERRNKIILKNELLDIFIQKLTSDYDFLNSSLISKVYFGSSLQWYRHPVSDYYKLNEITKEFLLDEHPSLREFVKNRFQSVIIPEDLNGNDFSDYMNLLETFKDECDYDRTVVMKTYTKSFAILQHTSDFDRFENLFPDEYDRMISEDSDFFDIIANLMDEEASNADESSLEDVLSEIKSAGDKYGVGYDDLKWKLEEKISAYRQKEEREYDWNDHRESGSAYNPTEEKNFIDMMFDSLGTEIRD